MSASPASAKLGVDKAGLFEFLRYQPHAGQWPVHNSQARFRALACGSRFGKSTAASMEIVAALLAPCPKALGWAVAPTAELTRFVMDRVRIAFLDHLRHRVIENDERSQRFVVRNLGGGLSELRAKSTESPANLLGEAVDFMVIDEAAKVRDEIWESYLSTRLIDRKGWALFISTPRRAQGWFYDAWRRGQKGRDAEYDSWRASTLSNPHISREIVEAERGRMSADSFAQEFDARFLGEENERCETCGNPDDRIVHDILFMDYESEPRCPVCGDIVDSQGHTRVFRPASEGPYLIIDGGPALRSRLEPGQDFATEVAKARAEMERRRSSTRLAR